MRTAFILSVFIFMSINLNSQVKTGLKFGYNTTILNYGRNEEPEFVDDREFQAFHLGVTNSLRLKNRFKKFRLGIDLFYIAKGLDPGPMFINDLVENTAALGATLQYELFPKFFILGGIELDYIFSRYLVNGFDFRNVKERNSSFDLGRNFNTGPVLGIQYKFAKRWELDFRYVLILQEDIPEFEHRVFDRSFMFSIHTYFGKKVRK